MTNNKRVRKSVLRKALFSSAISLILCCAMLVGTTFAWFTDSVTSANNIIKSGNLDVELYYQIEGQTDWTQVTEQTNIFKENTLWEPGHTEVVKLKVVNEGSLALKYQLSVNIASETPSTNVEGNTFYLSDHIKFGIVDGTNNYTREEAVEAVDASSYTLKQGYNSKYEKLLPGTTGNEKVVTMVVYMPTTVDNVANHKNDATAPEINLGINLFATQLEHESDSFDNTYDEDAPELTVSVTSQNIQEYLDGKHGDLTNMTLQLTAGNYGVLYLGRPTKYAGSNTVYTCETHDFKTTDAEAFKTHMAETGYHTTPKYTTTMQNVTIKGVDGASVAGVIATSGHAYGTGTDYVLDKNYTGGSIYYNTLKMNNITFKDVAFSGKIDINTSEANSDYNGIKFDGCSFTTGGIASSNGAAIRYYNEANNGKVRNITVNNCTFTNSYQGVYLHHVNGITITNNTFDTTGHNAIAIQGHDGAVDLKNVNISNNIFKNIGDRVIRFNNIGADSDITIEYNKATDSGDDANEVIKATSIAAGVKTTVNYNDWGTGKVVVNDEFKDNKKAAFASSAAEFKGAATDLTRAENIILLEDIIVEDLTYVNFAATSTVNGNGNKLVRNTASGNPLLVNTTNKVTFEDIVFESTKGSAVLATRKEGANIEVNNCKFQNNAAPSTGNTGVQVYASNVTMTFNNCVFNNMPVVTNSSYPEGIKLVFNNCTFNWEGDNCSGFIQIANNLKITVDLNNCKMNYTTNSQYSTTKNMISYNWPEACTINIDGLAVTGTRNNEKIWKICSSNNKVTINTSGTLSYTFNGNSVDFATYLK